MYAIYFRSLVPVLKPGAAVVAIWWWVKKTKGCAMDYYVYASDTNRKVRVHIRTCMYCKEGKGIESIPQSDRGWYGPFDTLAPAQEFATSLQRKDTRTCSLCLDGKRF